MLDERKCKMDRYYYSTRHKSYFFYIYWINAMDAIIQQKDIYIWGNKKKADAIINVYKLLDITIKRYLDELEDILAESNAFLIIVDDYTDEISDKMNNMGLALLVDYSFAVPFFSTLSQVRKNVLDIHMGVSYIGRGGCVGFSILGEPTDESYKILVLGSSTSDGELYPFKSWPEFLKEKFCDRNVTIYNGAVSSYQSSQELIKLIRDAVSIQPALILVYDGATEVNEVTNKEYPYYMRYPYIVYCSANRHKEELPISNYAEGAPFWGVGRKSDRFENWLINIRSMKAIAQLHGIEFVSFLQPLLLTKKNLNMQEKSIVFSCREHRIVPDFCENAKAFRIQIKEQHIEEKYDFIHDLSHIFDNENDIYMDWCHVYERGNKIIADEIYERIKDIIV